MNRITRAALIKNTEYHEALAEGYERLIAEATGGRKSATPDPNLKYLAELNAEAAKQLRDVLGSEAPPAIEQAEASRAVRRQQVGRLH
jgi:hypothetical protein